MERDLQQVLRARIAVHTSWANTHDPTARTAPGRKAFLSRFEKQVDPDGPLSPAERARRDEQAMNMARLALKSAKARRRRRS